MIVNDNYISELKENFSDAKFERISKSDGMFITNPINRSTNNDMRIYAETQVKRTLRSWASPFVSHEVKSKLAYFSQQEDTDEKRIYQYDVARDLQNDDQWTVQNIGHATQLIQFPGCTILTDPVFNNLSTLFYPEKTKSHPSIENLPKIDVIIISHNHRDHVDDESLKNLVKHHQYLGFSQPKLFVPLGDKTLFEQIGFDEVGEVDWFTKISIGDAISGSLVNFISIPADHRSGRYGWDHHKSLVIGWIINPMNTNVIIKYSGDTRSLTEHNQKAVDAILWNEIKCKSPNNNNETVEIPCIVFLEPSGPNYTRCDMDKTHQSTSYSALLKFIDAKNLATFSGKTINNFLAKIKTIMMHHNKFELGPDRFNEGLFVIKKLLNYLTLNDVELERELTKQTEKLQLKFDREKLLDSMPFTSKPIIYSLPEQTSLLVRSKSFIIDEMKQIAKRMTAMDKTQIRDYVIQNTIFPKIGERFNAEKLTNSTLNINSIHKYCMKPHKTE